MIVSLTKTVTDDELGAMIDASMAENLPGLERELGKRDAGFWTGATGRLVLRLLACQATGMGRKRAASYFITKRGVPINFVPEDELALAKKCPDVQHNHRNLTPLLISTISGYDEMPLHVLSLQPDADLELGRVVGKLEYKCKALH